MVFLWCSQRTYHVYCSLINFLAYGFYFLICMRFFSGMSWILLQLTIWMNTFNDMIFNIRLVKVYEYETCDQHLQKNILRKHCIIVVIFVEWKTYLESHLRRFEWYDIKSSSPPQHQFKNQHCNYLLKAHKWKYNHNIFYIRVFY